MNDAVVAAIIAAVVALFVGVLTAFGGYWAARSRLRQEFRTQFAAEEALIRLLQHDGYKRRSFAALRSLVGGFEDDELRKLLVRAGAFRFTFTEAKEYWGLLDRNPEGLDIIAGDPEQPRPIERPVESTPSTP